MSQLQPFYKQVQSHYDLSNDFFALFLDPSMTYSCAYFEHEDMTLQTAQRAKINLSLGKCDLHPGQRLLDIGCGWGATVCRAAEAHGVRAVGLTLSQQQHDFAAARAAELKGQVEIRLQGWEEFDEPVDRIVSIGAFEHFKEQRYAAFFEKCHHLLPVDGRMMLHCIVWPDDGVREKLGVVIRREDVEFVRFIGKKIFPGGQLRQPAVIRRYAEAAGFRVSHTQPLRLHYARTLDQWASNLQAQRDQAIELTSEDVYDTYMHYLTGCARYFRGGNLDVVQFTLCKD